MSFDKTFDLTAGVYFKFYYIVGTHTHVYILLFFLQPLLSDRLASHSSEHLSFVLLSYILFVLQPLLSVFLRRIIQNTCRLFRIIFSLFSSLFFSFSFFSLWSGLFCCVLVPGKLTFHLIYLDELQLFRLRFLTESDHSTICIFLG